MQRTYELIAAFLRESKPSTKRDVAQWERDVDTVAAALDATDERCNYTKFVRACGAKGILG